MRIPCPSIVRITRGEYAGRIAFYEDPLGPSEALVYFGEPLMAESAVIAFADMMVADVDDPAAIAFRRKYPVLAEVV